MSTAEDARQRNHGRGTQLEGDHRVVLRAAQGRLIGRIEPTATGTLELVLDPTGRSMTGRRLGPDGPFEIGSGR